MEYDFSFRNATERCSDSERFLNHPLGKRGFNHPFVPLIRTYVYALHLFLSLGISCTGNSYGTRGGRWEFLRPIMTYFFFFFLILTPFCWQRTERMSIKNQSFVFISVFYYSLEGIFEGIRSLLAVNICVFLYVCYSFFFFKFCGGIFICILMLPEMRLITLERRLGLKRGHYSFGECHANILRSNVCVINAWQ